RAVPWTDFLTNVASVDMRSDRAAMRVGDGPAELDREIRDAARRIENARRDNRVRRTCIEAQRAGAAPIERRRIRLERKTADDLAEKDPRSVVRIDHAGVLANPTNAGVLRVDALLHRTGVDVSAGFERLAGRLAHPREQPVETICNDVVVIVAPGVALDLRAPWIGALGRIRTIDVINGRRDDH